MIDSLPTCVCSDASLFLLLLRHGWRFRRRKRENLENDSRRDRMSQLTGSFFIIKCLCCLGRNLPLVIDYL